MVADILVIKLTVKQLQDKQNRCLLLFHVNNLTDVHEVRNKTKTDGLLLACMAKRRDENFAAFYFAGKSSLTLHHSGESVVDVGLQLGKGRCECWHPGRVAETIH